ncbi:MAG: 3-oxoacyl-[acyl-carrier-protein] synthase III C-terminal domain-containing protein [Pseudonocardiaceae bacterium]
MRAAGTLERIESFTPDRSVAIEDLADGLDLSRTKLSLFKKVHGLRTLRLDPGMDLLDLVLPAAERVLASVEHLRHVRYLIYAHASHELTPALHDAPAAIRELLKLEHAEAFGLSQQNCASGLGAIDVAIELLRGEGDAEGRALVVTGEKPFSRLFQLVPNTAIMGEAAAACLVAVGGGGHPVLSHVSRTLGEYANLISLPAEEAAQFGKIYAPVLADVMRQATTEAGLEFSNIDLVIPHNVNMLSWRQTIDELGITADRVFLDNIARFSHCFASDIFVNYTTLRETRRLIEGRHYLMVGVGAGATFSAMVMTYRGTR